MGAGVYSRLRLFTPTRAHHQVMPPIDYGAIVQPTVRCTPYGPGRRVILT